MKTLFKIAKEFTKYRMAFVAVYLEANDKYKERYSRFKKDIMDLEEKKINKKGVVYYNKINIGKLFNVDSGKSFLHLNDFVNGKYQ
ncbi:hypothetical protein KAJ87_00700 [Candidatus Pacearchaeota archaeon]|nr:hypothetical protein [Candidatus Pacearchaeota archaeon]